jgi:carbonic anhydrase
MSALLHPEAAADMPDVRSWLRHAEGARRALEAAGIPPDAPDAVSAITRLNVRLQLDHLRTHPQVFSRLRAGALQLHGWVYQIATGDVLAYDAAEDRWIALNETLATSPSRRPAKVQGARYAG